MMPNCCTGLPAFHLPLKWFQHSDRLPGHNYPPHTPQLWSVGDSTRVQWAQDILVLYKSKQLHRHQRLGWNFWHQSPPLKRTNNVQVQAITYSRGVMWTMALILWGRAGPLDPWAPTRPRIAGHLGRSCNSCSLTWASQICSALFSNDLRVDCAFKWMWTCCFWKWG